MHPMSVALRRATSKSRQSRENSDTYVVKLEFMTCTYFQWQSTGIPCSHAIAAILICRDDPQTYVQAFPSLDAYRHTYTATIHSPNADKADHMSGAVGR